jgi:hypothetical protein
LHFPSLRFPSFEALDARRYPKGAARNPFASAEMQIVEKAKDERVFQLTEERYKKL